MIQVSKARKKKTQRKTQRKAKSSSGSSAGANVAFDDRKGGGEIEAGHVDRIRNIIFGPQMRDYERRFQQIEKDLQRTLKSFVERMERHERSTQTKLEKIAGMAEDTGQATADVHNRLEDFRKATELDHRRLIAAHETLKTEVGKHLNRTAEQFAARLDDNREETRAGLEQLRQDQIQGLEDLHQDKASRAEFGEILIELGLRLKGEDVIPS